MTGTAPSSALRVAALVLAAALVLLAAPPAPAATSAAAGPTAKHAAPRSSDPPTPCGRLVAATPFSIGAGSCSGVRPGAPVRTRIGGCTMNFLFRGSDGRRYVGTAGHCILGSSLGEKSWRPGRGPLAWDGSGRQIGRFAYAVFRGEKDFAFIRLRKGVRSWARMCHFGGPTGINRETGSRLVRLQYYGQGTLVRSATAGRSAWATGMPHRGHVYANGVAVPGDSGSGVISADGRAVGVLVTGGVHLGGIRGWAVDAGAIGITRLGPQLWRAKKVMGVSLTLRTASPA